MEPELNETNLGQLIAIAPEEIPAHLKQGKAHLAAGRRGEALTEFGSILKVAPGDMETRVWMQKARTAMTKPEPAPLVEEAKPGDCVYTSMGLVANRQCTSDYNCLSCEFDRQMQDRLDAGEAELVEAMDRYKSLPGKQKFCRYALKGNISYRLCSRFLHCENCEFNQMMEDAFQQQLIQRQEYLRSKQQNWWWPYWAETSPK